MDARIVWKGRMSFIGEAESGFKIPLGTTPDVGGDNDGSRPMELLALGLGGCTAMDVISILQKKRQDVTAFEVQIHAERAEEHPRVFTSIDIEYIVTGNLLEREAVERAVQLSSEKYCPAQAMFNKILPLNLKVTINQL
jgi:putative redox protein